MASFSDRVSSILSGRGAADFVCPECGGEAHLRVRRPREGSRSTHGSAWCVKCGLMTELCSLEWRPELAAFQCRTVLVVLSDRLLREACSQFLAGAGFQVLSLEAPSELAALLEEQESPPVLLLTEASHHPALRAAPILGRIDDSRILVIGGSGTALVRGTPSGVPPLERPYAFEWLADNLGAEARKLLIEFP